MRGERMPGALALAQADGRDSSRRAVARWALPRRFASEETLGAAAREAICAGLGGEIVSGEWRACRVARVEHHLYDRSPPQLTI